MIEPPLMPLLASREQRADLGAAEIAGPTDVEPEGGTTDYGEIRRGPVRLHRIVERGGFGEFENPGIDAGGTAVGVSPRECHQPVATANFDQATRAADIGEKGHIARCNRIDDGGGPQNNRAAQAIAETITA